MANLVTITPVCDNDEKHAQPVEGKTYAVTIDGNELELELCDACYVEILKRIVAMARPAGQEPPNAGMASVHQIVPGSVVADSNGQTPAPLELVAEKGHYPCLWCPHEPYPSPTGLGLHVQRHGLPTSYVQLYGLKCPLCGDKTKQKLGLHLMQHHDGLTVPEAFQLALADGDPHGVVKPVLAKASA